MQEFYFEDKVNHKIVMGIAAHDDINCPPYDYYVFSQALSRSKIYNLILDTKGRPEGVDERFVNQMALNDSKRMLDDMLLRSLPDIKLQQILARTQMSKKEQIRLWKGVELKVTDLLWFDWLAQKAGYLLDVYHKGDVWHCFYGTYKGLNGEEPGAMGSQSHYHYISDKWGYSRAELNHFIETINMPSSPVHILFKHEHRK